MPIRVPGRSSRITALPTTRADRLARGGLCREQRSRQRGQGRLLCELRWLSDADQEKPGATGLALLQADRKLAPVGWAKAHIRAFTPVSRAMAPCQREVFRQIEPLRVGTSRHSPRR